VTNAGSDDVTVFAVDGAELRVLEGVASGGSTPRSVAVHGGWVYVLNTAGAPNIARLGGHVVAIENVVQHNVAGAAQNGLTVKGATDRSTLVTEGNVVRFSGGRGLSVTDNAEATFQDDYVADNQFAGSRVETTASGPADAMPAARFHGVALVCNRQAGLTGVCDPPPGGVDMPCTTAEDCCTGSDGTVDAACVAATRCVNSSVSGFGAVSAEAAGHPAPDVSYGDALQPGRNAFTSNRNTSGGANFRVPDSTAVVPAEGNQWEHCATGSPCSDVVQDISPPDAPIDLGAIPDPRATDGFGLVRVTPPDRASERSSACTARSSTRSGGTPSRALATAPTCPRARPTAPAPRVRA